MDDTIRSSVNSLGRRLHCVPCNGRFDPLVTRVRGNLSDPAFCNGSTSSVARFAGDLIYDSALAITVHF
jgi:hypothetical protein